MAARTLRPRHSDEIREKIKASQLVNRLQDHVFGETELSVTQMKAIEILLRKSVPDLSSQTLDVQGQLEVSGIKVEFVDAAK